MVQTTVLIPHRNRGEAVAADVLRLIHLLTQMGRSHEVIVIDDHSSPASLRPLQQLVLRLENVRLLRLDRPVGLSGTLTAGITAARGQQVVMIGAGDGYPLEQLEPLLDLLVRMDLVVGRPRRHGLAKVTHRLRRIPRWLLLGLEVRDPECLFWAARREALVGLELPRGMYRYLASVVAMRGYRVGELIISGPTRSLTSHDGWPNPGDLLATWWLRRRWCRFTTQQVRGTYEQEVVELEGADREPSLAVPRVWNPHRRSA